MGLDNVRTDMKKSSEAFVDLVWPVISPVLGGGRVVPVECMFDSEAAQALDLICGVDFLHINEMGARGIASRVQYSNPKYGDKNWETFTIRESRIGSTGETELEKRQRAIDSHGRFLYPYLTIQSYISCDGKSVVGVGVARTVDIFKTIDMGMFTRNSYDNANFLVIKYQDVSGVWCFG